MEILYCHSAVSLEATTEGQLLMLSNIIDVILIYRKFSY